MNEEASNEFKEGLFPTENPEIFKFNWMIRGLKGTMLYSLKDIGCILKNVKEYELTFLEGGER